jgi:hypothetical protein
VLALRGLEVKTEELNGCLDVVIADVFADNPVRRRRSGFEERFYEFLEVFGRNGFWPRSIATAPQRKPEAA